MDAKILIVAALAATMALAPSGLAYDSAASPDLTTAIMRIRPCGNSDHGEPGPTSDCANGYEIEHAGAVDIVAGVNDTDQLQVRLQMFEYWGNEDDRDGNNPSEVGYYPTDKYTDSCVLVASLQDGESYNLDSSYHRTFRCKDAVHNKPGDPGWPVYNLPTGTYVWDIPIGEMLEDVIIAGDDEEYRGNYLDLMVCPNAPGTSCIHYSMVRNRVYDEFGAYSGMSGGGARMSDAMDGDVLMDANAEYDVLTTYYDTNETIAPARDQVNEANNDASPLPADLPVVYNPMATPILLMQQPAVPCEGVYGIVSNFVGDYCANR